eukprot:scaffold48_cov395-Prasinococcus_capsulatus_cf.AAC.53
MPAEHRKPVASSTVRRICAATIDAAASRGGSAPAAVSCAAEASCFACARTDSACARARARVSLLGRGRWAPLALQPTCRSIGRCGLSDFTRCEAKCTCPQGVRCSGPRLRMRCCACSVTSTKTCAPHGQQGPDVSQRAACAACAAPRRTSSRPSFSASPNRSRTATICLLALRYGVRSSPLTSTRPGHASVASATRRRGNGGEQSRGSSRRQSTAAALVRCDGARRTDDEPPTSNALQFPHARRSGVVVGGDDDVFLRDAQGLGPQGRVAHLLRLRVEAVDVHVHHGARGVRLAAQQRRHVRVLALLLRRRGITFAAGLRPESHVPLVAVLAPAKVVRQLALLRALVTHGRPHARFAAGRSDASRDAHSRCARVDCPSVQRSGKEDCRASCPFTPCRRLRCR